MELIFTGRGEIQQLKHPNGHTIIPVPQRYALGRKRGGAPVCAPLFGSLPSLQPAWHGLKLPQHGLVRDEKTQCTIVRSKLFTETETVHQTEYTIIATKGYPWLHRVVAEVAQGRDALSLRHQIKVTNLEYGSTRPMPVSIGWHPYFHTAGSTYQILSKKLVFAETDTKLNPAVIYDNFGQTLSLRTLNYGLEIKSNSDEFVLWTDSSDYVCIEPVLGREQARTLLPGQSAVLTTEISITNFM